MVRDAQIDCALAELYHQGRTTSKMVATMRQSDAMQSVFSRLNEMEDMLTLAQHVSDVLHQHLVQSIWVQAKRGLKRNRSHARRV